MAGIPVEPCFRPPVVKKMLAQHTVFRAISVVVRHSGATATEAPLRSASLCGIAHPVAIVTYNYHPKRSLPKRRKSPAITCGRIVTIASKRRDLSKIPVGVADSRQPDELIRQYLADFED